MPKRDLPLRVGLVVDRNASLPAWMARLAMSVAIAPGIELAAIIEREPLAQPEGRSAVFDALVALERRFLLRLPRFAGPEAVEGLAHIPRIAAVDTSAVAAQAFDVLVDLTGHGEGAIDPRLARHGTWFLDCTGPASDVAALRQILSHGPVTTIGLYRLTQSDDEPGQIAQASLNTKYLAGRNAAFMREKAVTLVLRELRRLAVSQEVRSLPGARPPSLRPPGMGEILRYLVGAAGESTHRALDALRQRMGRRPGMFFIKSATGDIFSFEPAQAAEQAAPGNTYEADPFLWERDGRTYCFFETFDYASGRGFISVGELRDGMMVDRRVALDTDYHLSFPFLFEHEGELFMMPESSAKQRIEIWRCSRFPDRWELHATALEGMKASDSTIAEVDGQWWLFTNVSTDPFEEMNSELHLYRIDGPKLKELEPHPLNPVVFDTRCARNAGPIFKRDGAMFRPAQDNSHGTYGYGLNIMRIESLSMEGYSESCVRSITPDFEAGLVGCHHIDARGDQIVMDACRRVGGR